MMFRRSIFRAGIFNVALLILLSKYTIGYNEVTIVGLFPVVKAKDEYTNVVDVSGVKRLAAAKMAIDHINNKNDFNLDGQEYVPINYRRHLRCSWLSIKEELNECNYIKISQKNIL